MTDKPLDDEDKKLFRQAMRGIKPLSPSSKTVPTVPIEKTNTAYRRRKAQQVEPIMNTFPSLQMVTEADSVLSYHEAGLSAQQWKNMKMGRIAIDAKLDLHGYTLEHAFIRLEGFFEMVQGQGFRYVLIVHGKGHSSSQQKPVIKNLVLAFLKARSDIVAFHSAPAALGGAGAVIVLLKKILY